MKNIEDQIIRIKKFDSIISLLLRYGITFEIIDNSYIIDFSESSIFEYEIQKIIPVLKVKFLDFETGNCKTLIIKLYDSIDDIFKKDIFIK